MRNMTVTFEEAIIEMYDMAAQLRPAAKDITFRSVKAAAAIAASLAPFDTGALHDSILQSPKVEDGAGAINGSWGSDLDYDYVVEYGNGKGRRPNFHHRQAAAAIIPVWESQLERLILQGPGFTEEYPDIGGSEGLVLRRS